MVQFQIIQYAYIPSKYGDSRTRLSGWYWKSKGGSLEWNHGPFQTSREAREDLKEWAEGRGWFEGQHYEITHHV